MGNNRDLERFMRKVRKLSNGCWRWEAAKKGNGYGAFFLNGKLRGAHRAALYLFKGLDIETALDAMHSCDNPSCVNPEHISYGTRAENMIDASRKGRIVRVQDWRGALNPRAKLTESQAAEIVNKVNAGETRKEVAKLFDVSDVRIGQIMKAAGFPSDLSATEAARLTRLARTHCKRGHQLSGENMRINSDGARVCRQCEKANALARKIKSSE